MKRKQIKANFQLVQALFLAVGFFSVQTSLIRPTSKRNSDRAGSKGERVKERENRSLKVTCNLPHLRERETEREEEREGVR